MNIVKAIEIIEVLHRMAPPSDLGEAAKFIVDSQYLIEDMANYIKGVYEEEASSYGAAEQDAYLYRRVHEFMGWEIPEEYK